MEETLPRYEIRVEGHLAPRRLRRFEGVVVRHVAGGETIISVRVRDQTVLYGLLSWLQRLGLTLVQVQRRQQ